ncbi:MAG: hypothetical protein GY866_02350 [Proteobacteria bacterium]|nr:hypothetical protein [Pseudomonadota bacterium]
MKITANAFLLLFLNLVFLVSHVSAETVLLENEEVIQGTITNYSNESIIMETDSGTREVSLTEIHLIDYLGSAKDYQKEAAAPNAFVVYLKNGEVIEGIISQYTNEILSLQSTSGHGVLDLPTSSVKYITTKKPGIDMNQRKGVGFIQKTSTLNSSSGLATYTSNQLSYKLFLEKKMFGNVQLAYGDASYNGKELKIFAADLRLGLVFQQFQNVLLYYGGSGGLLQIKDDSTGVNGSGYTASGFLGAEVFFSTLPNFGFSGELGIQIQNAGDYSSSSLSISSFPTFSIHYYF